MRLDDLLRERGLMARFYDQVTGAQIFLCGAESIELPANAGVRTFRIPEMRYGEVARTEDVRAAHGS